MKKRKHTIRTVQEKEVIYKHYQEHGWKATGKKYKLPYSTFVFWRNRVKAGGNAPLSTLLARKPKRHTVSEEAVALVRQAHRKDPTLSLAQLQKIVHNHKLKISRTTVWHLITGR